MTDEFDGLTLDELVADLEDDTEVEETDRAAELVGELVTEALKLGENLHLRFMDGSINVVLDEGDDE